MMRPDRLTGAAAVMLILMIAGAADAAVKTRAVTYQQGGVQLKGYVAWDDGSQAARPGVLVLPEWWGVTNYPKRRARELAQLGYVAMVADLYGEGKHTADPKQAGRWAHQLHSDRKLMRQRAAAGLAELVKQPHVDKQKLAAIGYCFGGGAAVELAYTGADLKGIVSFHGHPQPAGPGDAQRVKAKMLILHGGADPTMSPQQLEAFFKSIDKAGVDWQLIVYSGAKHAFTNPGVDRYHLSAAKYNAEADHRSWKAMKQFFAEIFGSK